MTTRATHQAASAGDDAAIYAFVYGTLRAGEINDMMRAAERHQLPAPAYVGTSVLGGRLYDFGRYPGMVLSANADELTIGDIYRIPAALVAVLDEIEEVYPGEAGLFVRELHEVACDGQTYNCIVYPVNEAAVAGLPRIAGGDWVDYRKSKTTSAA
ncbi:gamma-glutamylcyclotransferase family protein [Pandoraea pneumonica]|uniref:gamma-glutamylcyclotransferase family protein n=1 Tax=Pandoraea pneumonica TaxID=2508299 RepID=UPI003CF9FD5F